MVTLEQVKLLESKVIKAVDCIREITEENTMLKGKLSGYEKRIGELETLIEHFKEDQGRIEKGIISALERLDQFEDAIDSAMVNKKSRSAAQKAFPDKPDTRPAEKPKPLNDGQTIMPSLPLEDNLPADDESAPGEKSGELEIF